MDALSRDKSTRSSLVADEGSSGHCRSLPSTGTTTPRPICGDSLLILLVLFPQSRAAAYIHSSQPEKYGWKRIVWLWTPGPGAGASQLMASLLSIYDENEFSNEQ